MSQSNAIFAAIFIAYVIFITMRGELPVYLGLLLNSGAAPGSSPGASLHAQTTAEQAAQSQMAVDTAVKGAQAAAFVLG